MIRKKTFSFKIDPRETIDSICYFPETKAESYIKMRIVIMIKKVKVKS